MLWHWGMCHQYLDEAYVKEHSNWNDLYSLSSRRCLDCVLCPDTTWQSFKGGWFGGREQTVTKEGGRESWEGVGGRCFGERILLQVETVPSRAQTSVHRLWSALIYCFGKDVFSEWFSDFVSNYLQNFEGDSLLTKDLKATLMPFLTSLQQRIIDLYKIPCYIHVLPLRYLHTSLTRKTIFLIVKQKESQMQIQMGGGNYAFSNNENDYVYNIIS